MHTRNRQIASHKYFSLVFAWRVPCYRRLCQVRRPLPTTAVLMRDADVQIIFLPMLWRTTETVVSTDMPRREYRALSGPLSITNWAVRTEMDWLSAQGNFPIAPQGSSVNHSSLRDKNRCFTSIACTSVLHSAVCSLQTFAVKHN